MGVKFDAIVAEFFGTFALLLSILVTGNVYAIAATFLAIIWLIGGVSGAHINPAVSLVFYLNKTLDTKKFLVYVVSQFAGAVAAYGTTKLLKL